MGKEIELSTAITDIAAGPFGSNLKVECFVPSGFPIIDGANLKGYKVTDNITKFVTEEKARSLSRSIAHRGDVIVTISGTIGQIAYIPEDSLYDEYLCSQRQFRVSFDSSMVYVPYLVFYFHTFEGQNKILSFANQTGVPALSQPLKNFKKIRLCLPSLQEQRRIASIVETINDKIENNIKINDNLYEMVNAYYTSLFKESDCEMTTVGNYAERIYSGGTPMTSNAAYWNGTFGWFSSGETRNRFVISTEKTITQAGIDNSSTKLATKYDIVMASAGQGFTRGQTSMLLIDTYVNQSVIVIKSERNILPYLFWNLVNRYDELRAISDSSSIRGSLTTKMIAAFEIPLANEQSLQAFADFAWSVIPQIENNLLENERLTALRDSLLPKLMSGEIDVTDIQL